MPVPPRNLVTQRRACAWRFEFCFCMSQHHNIGLIVNNARNPFQAARIISYATEKADSEIKVTGLIAGDQMRGCAVQRYLSHVEIRNLQLTPIEGGHTDRSNDPFIRMFLSLPAANDSAFAQAGHPPPATPEHGVRVDLHAPSIMASSEQELGALQDRVQVGLHAELCWLGRRLSRCPQRSLEAAGAAALGCRWTARAARARGGGRRPRHPRHLPGKLIRRGLPRLGSPPTPTVQRSSLSHWRLDSSRVLWQLCQNCSQSNRQPLRQSSAARVMKSVR